MGCFPLADWHHSSVGASIYYYLWTKTKFSKLLLFQSFLHIDLRQATGEPGWRPWEGAWLGTPSFPGSKDAGSSSQQETGWGGQGMQERFKVSKHLKKLPVVFLSWFLSASVWCPRFFVRFQVFLPLVWSTDVNAGTDTDLDKKRSWASGPGFSSWGMSFNLGGTRFLLDPCN